MILRINNYFHAKYSFHIRFPAVSLVEPREIFFPGRYRKAANGKNHRGTCIA